MRKIFQSPYSGLFALGLLLQLIAAWFSEGHHHPDEHFQILEFCNYKMGNSPATDLPWEFSSQMRPTLQPYIAYFFVSAFKLFGIQDPFLITFFLRSIIAVLGWLVICKIALHLLPGFNTEKSRKLFIALLSFLWFVPYLNVRFSSENAAGISLLWAIYLLLQLKELSSSKKTISLLCIGALLSASFFFRFQMAFAIIGLGIWLLWIEKINLKSWLLIISSGMIVLIICLFLDKSFYGNWVFTPFNYYDSNITQKAAANAGVDPWWYYVPLFVIMAIPPLGLALLFFFGIGVYSKPKSVFCFIIIPFIVAHAIIGHKEMRFLFPVWFAFIYIVANGIDFYLVRNKPGQLIKIAYWFLVIVNFIFLIYRTFAPAQEAILSYKFIHSYFKNKTGTILCQNEPLFSLVGLKTNFYKNKMITEIVFKNEQELNGYLQKNTRDSVVVFSKTSFLESHPVNYHAKRIYCLFPEWILKFNFNNWEDRANIWSFYLLTKTNKITEAKIN